MTPDEVKELMSKGLITQVIDPVDIVNNMETPPMGGCECTDYVLPIASEDVLGGVKIGSGSMAGGLSINDTNGCLTVKYAENRSGLETDRNGFLMVRCGNGLSIGDDGKLNVTVIGGSDYTLPPATTVDLGGIKVGEGLTASSDGKLGINIGTGLNINSLNGLCVPTATKDSYGSVMIGAGLNIGNDKKLNIGSATSAKLGGIKVGNNLSISSDGTLSATDTKYNNASTSAAGLMSKEDKSKLDGITAGANKYTLPVASENALGGVKIGNGIIIGTDGQIDLDIDYIYEQFVAKGYLKAEQTQE